MPKSKKPWAEGKFVKYFLLGMIVFGEKHIAYIGKYQD